MKSAFLCGIIFCSATVADDSKVPIFKAVCNEEVAAGLRATSGGWRPTEFRSDKTYLIEKKDGECEYEYKNLPDIEKNRQVTSNGCYLIQDLSRNAFRVHPKLCKEWASNGPMENPLFRIDCGHITFNPTKGYIRHHIHQGIEASDAVGNDIFVAAGNCRIIK